MGKFEQGNTIGHRFKPGDPKPPGSGRPPRLKKLPKNFRAKVMEALAHALTLPDAQTAADYLNRKAEELPEFGFMIQAYARGMLGKNSIFYLSDILDRLIGKPKTTTDMNLSGGLAGINVTVEDPETAANLNAVLKANRGGEPVPKTDGEE